MRKVATTILILALISVPLTLRADDKLNTALDTANKVAAPSIAATTSSSSTSDAQKETGTSASEVLPGNGSRAGYVLSHGNIITDSEYVYIGAKHATRGKDYSIDYSSGTLFFTEAVRQFDSVQVDYRYSEKSNGQRSVTGPGMLPFAFGEGLKMNLMYSYRAADSNAANGADILTYGFANNSSLGSGKVSGMMFISNPQSSARLLLNSAGTKVAGVDSTAKKDSLIQQNMNLGLGNAKVQVEYQDVGKDFSGFNSMRETKAAADDVINQLEKEKGIQRMNVAGTVPTGKDMGLNFSFGQIGDDNGKILTQSFGYASNSFKFSFSNRNVDKDFNRFNDLREADRAQMAAQVGMQRTNYAFQLRTAMLPGNKPVWSGFSFMQLTGDSGTLNYHAFDLDFGKVNLQADIRTMDPGFSQMNALNDDERTRMALMARQQFDPKAQASQVTAKDKNEINNEAGINRSTYVVKVDGGPLNTWMSLSNVDSKDGGISRSAFALDMKAFGFSVSHQTIDPTFSRLSSLQEVERSHFGNEFGMTRTQMGGRIDFAGGEAVVNSANVTDYKGASVVRRSLSFQNPRMKFQANFQDIESEFSRILDLSDADKSLMLQERGFRKADYWVNFQATKALNIDSYIYDSTNTTADQTRSQSRHKIVYTPRAGQNLTLFQDDYSYISDDGVLSSYSRRKVTFDNSFKLLGGLLFKGLNDVNTTQDANGSPVTTTVTQTHMESDQKVKTSFTHDMLNTDYGNGKYEDIQTIGIKSQILRNLALVSGFSTISRDSNNSENNGSLGVDWGINKNLKMRFSMSNRDGGPNGSQQSHQFSLNGLLAKRFLLFDNIKVGSGMNETTLRGKQTGLDNSCKLEAGLLGGNLLFDNGDKLNSKNGVYYGSRIFQYESNKDPKKRYHLTFFRQNLVTQDGTPAVKRNYAMDMKLSNNTNMTFTSYLGKDEKNGTVLPVGGTVFKLNHLLNNGMTMTAGLSRDTNSATNRRANEMGLGLSGNLPNKASFEFYYGFADLVEGVTSESKNVFRIKYDQRVDADHFVTLSAERKSGIDKSAINPYEGDTVFRIDFRTVFH